MKQVKLYSNNKGFTLIELMVVVIIISILIAISIPRFTKLSDKAKVKSAMVEIKSIKDLIDIYIAEEGSVPDADNEVNTGTIAKVLLDYGINWNELQDPWNKTYTYFKNDDGNYQIKTGGPDGKPGEGDDDIWASDSTQPQDRANATDLEGENIISVQSNSAGVS